MAEQPERTPREADVPSPARRGLLAWAPIIGAAITALLATPILGVLSTSIRKPGPDPQWVDVGAVDEFAGHDHREVEFAYNVQDTWLPTTGSRRVSITEANGDFLVLGTTCTHLGCGVQWSSVSQEFHCPCHGGVFDADGNKTAGPPQRPLKRYQTEVRDGRLLVREDYQA